MPTLNIPERYQAGIQKVAELPELALNALIATLNEVSASVSSKERISSVASKLNSVSPDDLELILRTLDSLYKVRAHLEVPLDGFVSDVVNVLRTATPPKVLSEESERIFRSRLTALLSVAPLAISAKAQILQREYSYLFHDAKIITDVRPVFGQNTTQPPDGMILDHTLKLVYHEGLGDHRELYLALDQSDLIELKEVIKRAEEKEQTLRGLLQDAGIKVF